MKKEIPHSQKVLNLWGIILIIWAFYRLKLKMPEWFDELLAKPVIFVLPVYYFIKKVENKKFFSSLNWSFKSLKKDLLLSLLLSFVFLLTIFSANWVKTGKIISISKNITSSYFFYVFIISLVGAACEQVLSTGFVFERLYLESKNFYQTAFLSALLFFFLHVPLRFTLPNLVGSQLIFLMLTDIFLSLLNSYFYHTEKSLNIPIFIHAFYNIIILLMI
jgi:membrane protease YdiL (CAAX protease family)